MRPSLRYLTAVALTVACSAALVAGCGGGTGEDPLRQAMAEQFSAAVGLGPDDASCYAGKLIAYYGTEEMQRFVDNPATFQPAEPADQAVLLGALDDCGIDPRQLQAGSGEPAELELERVDDPATATTTTP